VTAGGRGREQYLGHVSRSGEGAFLAHEEEYIKKSPGRVLSTVRR